MRTSEVHILGAIGLILRLVRHQIHLVGNIQQRLAVLDGPTLRIGNVEPTQFGQRLERRRSTQRRQPHVEVALHAVCEVDGAIRIASLAIVHAAARAPEQKVARGIGNDDAGNICRIHDGGPLTPERCDRFVHHRRLRRVDSAAWRARTRHRERLVEERAWHANTRALQSIALEKRPIVAIDWRCAAFRGRVIRIGRRAFECAKHDGRVFDRAGHGAGGVLVGRDGNDAIATDATDRGFDADDHVLVGRAEHGARSLGPNVRGPEAGGRADTRTRSARAHRGTSVVEAGSRIGTWIVRVHTVAAHGAVVAGHWCRAASHPVRELRHHRFREDDRTGVLQVLCQRRLVGRHKIPESQCTARSAHVGRVNVVLERHRNSVQRSAHSSLRAFSIERVGFGQRGTAHGDYGVQGMFIRGDARQVQQHQLA